MPSSDRRAVIAIEPIPPVKGRPPVPVGTRGTVTGEHPSGWLPVRFENGRQILVPGHHVEPA